MINWVRDPSVAGPMSGYNVYIVLKLRVKAGGQKPKEQPEISCNNTFSDFTRTHNLHVVASILATFLQQLQIAHHLWPVNLLTIKDIAVGLQVLKK